jgi:NADPH:quinone reductase-like Zn-dependent oxidoreductase
MKAVRIHETGGPEVLRYEDIPEPQLRKDQVLVRVKACAMNHLDLWIRKGIPKVKLPHILGSDVAGEIVEIGEYVSVSRPANGCCLLPCIFAIIARSAPPACKTNAANLPYLEMRWMAAIASWSRFLQ